MDKKVVTIGKSILINNLSDFIGKMNFIYQKESTNTPNFMLSLWQSKETDLVGAVVLYKLLEYSVVHQCFNHPEIFISDSIKANLKNYRFQDLILELINGKDIRDEFNRLKIEIQNDFFIAPIALQKGLYKPDLNNEYYPKIAKYYQNEEKSLMIFQFLTELYSNFDSHAEDNSKSIMVAHGDKNQIEIVCVDSGKGIVTTMQKIYPKRNNLNLLQCAVKKFVTSSAETNHMGYGLWYIDEVIRITNGRLDIRSEDAYYKRMGRKTWISRAPKWKGTIVSVKLPLSHPILISQLETEKIDLVNFKN